MICADELGPVIPRTFPPAPTWSPGRHGINAELDYSRGPEKTWVYGGLRPTDGQAVTMTPSSRNSVFYQQFLQWLEQAHPDGEIWIVTDNLSSDNSLSTRTWLEDHPRIHHAFILVGACWLNLQEGWWRIFRKATLAGRSFATRDDIDQATALASDQLNSRASPWSGADPHRQLAYYGADMCTSFEEFSTRSNRAYRPVEALPAPALVSCRLFGCGLLRTT
ncbi:transposase [Streptomyces sp. NBC_00885]|uniref:transposase n=1 Tax=Streptomyces sp. NBC_00885 TaxID=2975857 RepID=UPI00386FF9E9|nr:transposase [Streptomyces sp. NBC_00885]